ncbi:MAG: sigma-70 family RNA polymerase sigma factor [Nannocystaceae bacterium]
MVSDHELLDAWRAGDAQAGQELFTRHFDAACRFFYNKADEGVDDLIQQTFLGCLESRERFRGDSSFFTFLIGVAKNVLRLHYRRKRRAERVDFGSTSVHDLSPSPSRVVAQQLDQQRVLQALRTIPLDLQMVLELHYWEELPASRIAEALEIPPGTAKTRLRRGKQLLREELTRHEPTEDARSQLALTLDERARGLRKLFPGGG